MTNALLSFWLPGEYEVISDTLNVRYEPRIASDNNNIQGRLVRRDRRPVYEFVTSFGGFLWGRISEIDEYGKAQWVCAKQPNKTYLKFTKAFSDAGDTTQTTNTSKVRLYINDVLVFSAN